MASAVGAAGHGWRALRQLRRGGGRQRRDRAAERGGDQVSRGEGAGDRDAAGRGLPGPASQASGVGSTGPSGRVWGAAGGLESLRAGPLAALQPS